MITFTAISDTHGLYKEHLPPVPEDADILIHAGDISGPGEDAPLSRIAHVRRFFDAFPHKRKVFVPGNWDMCFQRSSEAERELAKSDVVYLENAGATIAGVKMYGMPNTNGNANHAFSSPDQSIIKRNCAKIPEDTQILITHAPPHGILDGYDKDQHFGYQYIRRAVDSLRRLRAHVFGHVHRAGVVRIDGKIFINAAIKRSDRSTAVVHPEVFHVDPEAP